MEERQELETLIAAGKAAVGKRHRARSVLCADENHEQGGMKDHAFCCGGPDKKAWDLCWGHRCNRGWLPWRDYNKRAGCERVIKELNARACAVEALGRRGRLEQKVGRQDQQGDGDTLRHWLFVMAGVLDSHAQKSTLKFAVPKNQQPW